jgi:hypothetical protein
VLGDQDIGGFTVTTLIDKTDSEIRFGVTEFLDGRTGIPARSGASRSAPPGGCSPRPATTAPSGSGADRPVAGLTA